MIQASAQLQEKGIALSFCLCLCLMIICTAVFYVDVKAVILESKLALEKA